jgi:hypothetical protein
VQPSFDALPKKTAALLVVAAFAIFGLVDVLVFHTRAYRGLLDPSSSTGSFEAAIAQFRAVRPDPGHDVLVLGDSRIYSGLDPRMASIASGDLRFLNGGVPGATPRTWPFFVRAIDPDRNRFRAVVIAVDTYGDDDSAIGSLDGDNRSLDLRYVVLQTRLGDIPKLAGSFPDPRERIERGLDLLWRGPELRDDFQAFAANPVARLTGIAQARNAQTCDPLAAHPRSETLAGIRVDFARGTIHYPARISDDERRAIAAQVLRVGKASPSYARYRMEWLAPIAARYAAAGVPVIFVRIPTRPAHRATSEIPSGSLLAIARDLRARLIPAAGYLALERPELFADEDHLNRAGSLRFSRLLGTDVARKLSDRAPRATTAGIAPPASAPEESPHGPMVLGANRDRGWDPAALSILRVLALLRDRRGAFL